LVNYFLPYDGSECMRGASEVKCSWECRAKASKSKRDAGV